MCLGRGWDPPHYTASLDMQIQRAETRIVTAYEEQKGDTYKLEFGC